MRIHKALNSNVPDHSGIQLNAYESKDGLKLKIVAYGNNVDIG
jgi:hypothetical protein